ncbi:ABC transporter ATP-binding protein [bacterium]|nr:ABC transporter ATP-binding protein [bacterium]
MSQQSALISVKDVKKNFLVAGKEIQVLKQCNFDIVPGSFTIIYGASGSGKSTLLDAISGLAKPTSGIITFKGQNVYELDPDERANFRANNLGLVYQSNYWVASMSVLDNVSMPLYLSGHVPIEAHKQAKEVLERLKIDHLMRQKPGVLSGGEQQRVSLARALVSDPDVIIADEPTGNLDTKNGDVVMNLLSSLQKLGKTIVMVTHNLEYLPLSTHQIRIVDGVVSIGSDADGGLTNEQRAQYSQRLASSFTSNNKGRMTDGLIKKGAS